MGVLNTISCVLLDPRVKNIDVDNQERMAVHRRILSEKQMMRGVYCDFYRICLDIERSCFCQGGRRIEVGSGAGFFGEFDYGVILTDITPAWHLDMVLNAEQMPFADKSIRAVFGINCFHHFSNPDNFLSELMRVLMPAGGCVLIEPYYGILAAPFYRNLHRLEYFDKKQRLWTAHADSKGAMSNANQALSYIVFKRDRDKFLKSYPKLEIVRIQTISNYLRYLASGGVNFRQLLPDFMIPALKILEAVLRPLEAVLALHQVIIIRKRR